MALSALGPSSSIQILKLACNFWGKKKLARILIESALNDIFMILSILIHAVEHHSIYLGFLSCISIGLMNFIVRSCTYFVLSQDMILLF